MTNRIEPDESLFVAHGLPEQRVELGEIAMNYAVAGAAEAPALLLVPPQTHSWWTYEDAMALLAERFQVFAVDLRGQGRSSRTPGRYTLDTMGGDLVRFLDLVVGRPAVVSGNSSGGVLAAWLAAYAKPGQIRGVVCEDPPLFASEVNPAVGHSIRQAIGPLFAAMSTYLGDQGRVGDWAGLQAALRREVPGYVLQALGRMATTRPGARTTPPDGPPQNLREYDPEWARAFWTGTVAANCDHARMLGDVRAPVLLTHHVRAIDPATGGLMGAISDEQARHAGELIRAAGQRFEYVDLPDMAHSLHAQDPAQFARIVGEWAAGLRPDPA